MKKLLNIFTFIALSISAYADGLVGGIRFGDSEKTVIKKLEMSKLVSTDLDKGMFGRVGLNGTFTTTNTLHGMKFKLYFDWDFTGSQKQIIQLTYRSAPLSMSSYNNRLKSAWQYSQNLLTTMYGKPSNAGDYPSLGKLADGGIMYSHAWDTDDGHVYLGIGKQDGKLNLSIGFHKNSLN